MSNVLAHCIYIMQKIIRLLMCNFCFAGIHDGGTCCLKLGFKATSEEDICMSAEAETIEYARTSPGIDCVIVSLQDITPPLEDRIPAQRKYPKTEND